MLCSLSTKIGDDELKQIVRLEQELGYSLLAFSCHSTEPADLTGEQLDKIKELEASLGLSLVAVEA